MNFLLKSVNYRFITYSDSIVRHDAAQKMGDWPPEVDLQE
jgi:hypothetical protein